MFRRIFTALSALLAAVSIAYAVNISGTFQSTQNQIVRLGYLRLSVTDNITAFAGGGQASAVLLDSAFNRIATVASGNDSVKLPSCRSGANATGMGDTIGLQVTVTNSAASNAANVFPQTGESINALSANSAFSLAAGKTVQFTCGPQGGVWYGNLSA